MLAARRDSVGVRAVPLPVKWRHSSIILLVETVHCAPPIDFALTSCCPCGSGIFDKVQDAIGGLRKNLKVGSPASANFVCVGEASEHEAGMGFVQRPNSLAQCCVPSAPCLPNPAG